MKNWKKKFELLALAMLLFATSAFAQVERSKKIDRSYTGKSVVELVHANGPLNVQPSSDGKVHVHAELMVKAKTDEAASAVFEHFGVEVAESGNRVEIETAMGYESRVVSNLGSWVKFKDGKKIKGVEEFRVSVTLLLPSDLTSLTLENKYDDISIGMDIPGDLKVKLYSGSFLTGAEGNSSMGNVAGELDLSMKYSKARIGSAGRATLDIYDSKLRTGELASAEISSKYSEVEIGGVKGDLEMDTYDDEWKVGSVGGKLKLKDKYSEFEFKSLADVWAEIYDANIQVETAGKVNIDASKYSEYRFGEVRILQFEDSYDDDIRIGEAQAVSANTSKYSEFRVDRLSTSFGIGQSYDDAVELDWVAKDFQSINLNGKYTELDVDIEDGATFELKVNMKYGKFDYPESELDIRTWKEKDSMLEIIGVAGGVQSAPGRSFIVSGYDNDIDWN